MGGFGGVDIGIQGMVVLGWVLGAFGYWLVGNAE